MNFYTGTLTKKTEHGAALVEFAIVLPLFLILIFGVLEISLILIQDNTLNKSARDSSRYVTSLWALPGCNVNIAKNNITNDMNSLFSSNYSQFVENVNGTIIIDQVCIRKNGEIANESPPPPDVGTLCTGTLNLCDDPNQKLHIRTRVSYDHQMLLDGIMGFNFTPTLSATSIMRVQ